MWTLYALELICLYFFNWVQISKFTFKTFRGLVWSGRRNLMRLLALFQPLYHQPPFLGVCPLAGGEKAKVQFKPKTDIGEEGKCLTCKAVEEHSSISPASHRLGRSRKASRVSMPRSKRNLNEPKGNQTRFYKLRLSLDNSINTNQTISGKKKETAISCPWCLGASWYGSYFGYKLIIWKWF